MTWRCTMPPRATRPKPWSPRSAPWAAGPGLSGRPAGRGRDRGPDPRRNRRPWPADRAGQQRLDLRIRPDRHRHPPKLGPPHRIQPARALCPDPGLRGQCPPAVTDEDGEPLAQGLIVNMIDQRILKLTPEFTTYTIAKMGLWALTRTAAQGLAPHVRVNAIGPGPTLQGARQSARPLRPPARRHRSGAWREPGGYHCGAWLLPGQPRPSRASFWRSTAASILAGKRPTCWASNRSSAPPAAKLSTFDACRHELVIKHLQFQGFAGCDQNLSVENQWVTKLPKK